MVIEVGDIVRRAGYRAERVVTKLGNPNEWTKNKIQTSYVKSKQDAGWDNTPYFILVSKAQQEEPMSEGLTKDGLYAVKQTNGTTRGTVYANYLATNSKGEHVMENKATGEIFTALKADIEEVVPYTFRVTYKDATTAYQGTEGVVKVGDILINAEGNIGRVSAVNTKQKGCGEFKGRRVVTAEF